MEKEICFERCIDFLAKMFEKYGGELEIVKSVVTQTEDNKEIEEYGNL